MEVKTYVHFSTQKEDTEYVFTLPAGGTLGGAYDSLYEFLEKVNAMSKEATEKAKRPEEDKSLSAAEVKLEN